MDDKNYRDFVCHLVKRIISVSFLNHRAYTTQDMIAHYLGISSVAMSRASTGVCSLSGPKFFRLCGLAKDILGEESFSQLLCVYLPSL